MSNDRSCTLATVIDQRKSEREAIESDIEAFLKQGGKITKIKPGETSEDRADYGRVRVDRN